MAAASLWPVVHHGARAPFRDPDAALTAGDRTNGVQPPTFRSRKTRALPFASCRHSAAAPMPAQAQCRRNRPAARQARNSSHWGSRYGRTEVCLAAVVTADRPSPSFDLVSCRSVSTATSISVVPVSRSSLKSPRPLAFMSLELLICPAAESMRWNCQSHPGVSWRRFRISNQKNCLRLGTRKRPRPARKDGCQRGLCLASRQPRLGEFHEAVLQQDENKQQKKPIMIRVHQKEGEPSNRKLVWISPIVRTTSVMPNISPPPPVKSLPAITTAAMTVSSVPTVASE